MSLFFQLLSLFQWGDLSHNLCFRVILPAFSKRPAVVITWIKLFCASRNGYLWMFSFQFDLTTLCRLCFSTSRRILLTEFLSKYFKSKAELWFLLHLRVTVWLSFRVRTGVRPRCQNQEEDQDLTSDSGSIRGKGVRAVYHDGTPFFIFIFLLFSNCGLGITSLHQPLPSTTLAPPPCSRLPSAEAASHQTGRWFRNLQEIHPHPEVLCASVLRRYQEKHGDPQ